MLFKSDCYRCVCESVCLSLLHVLWVDFNLKGIKALQANHTFVSYSETPKQRGAGALR